MPSHHIDIIPSNKIDKTKWDKCIQKSPNDLLYARSFYLDQMTDNWHGIVVNDYDGVMPVPWRKKLGIRYCYDVPFIQQLGYYSTIGIDHTKFTDPLLQFVKYGHYNFNYGNSTIANYPGIKITTNFIIDLTGKELVTNNFTKSFKQSLHNAERHDLIYCNASAGEAIEMYKDLYKAHLKNISESDYQNLLQLTSLLSQQNKCVARKINNTAGQTLSVVLLLQDDKRLYNIINATNLKGRETESNYLLYAEILKEFAGKGLLFDLEGSEIPGVKSFYKKLGAIDQPYYRIHINNLPFPLKLLKA